MNRRGFLLAGVSVLLAPVLGRAQQQRAQPQRAQPQAQQGQPAQQPAQRDAGAAAGALAVGPVLARIEAARAGVRTLEAAFDQERVMGLFAQTIRARGRLVVQRPDRVRWEVLAPDPGVFVVAGGRVSYRAGQSQASATQQQAGALGAVLADLAAFLGGALAPLQRRYRIEAADVAGGGVALTAVPLDPAVARSVSRLRLVFRADLRVIETIEIDEPGGDRSVVRVRDAVLNSGRVAPEAFQP